MTTARDHLNFIESAPHSDAAQSATVGAVRYLLAREAEREATPPSAGDGDEVVTTTALPHSRACGFRKHDHGVECSRNCPTCGGSVIAPRTPPPAPVHKAVSGADPVEAMARLLASTHAHPYTWEQWRIKAQHTLASLELGMVPGFGRTGKVRI